MTKPIDKNTLRFLMRKENLPAVLEVLRYHDPITERLRGEFWSGLNAYLQKTTPQKLSKIGLRLEGSVWGHPGIGYRDDNMRGKKQSLIYFIDQESWGGKQRIIFGLAWSADESPKIALTKLPDVLSAKKRFKELGFKRSTSSIGWQEMPGMTEDSVEAFLSINVFGPQQSYRQIKDSFWPMVDATYELMLQANKAIKKTISSG